MHYFVTQLLRAEHENFGSKLLEDLILIRDLALEILSYFLDSWDMIWTATFIAFQSGVYKGRLWELWLMKVAEENFTCWILNLCLMVLGVAIIKYRSMELLHASGTYSEIFWKGLRSLLNSLALSINYNFSSELFLFP